MTKAHSLPPHIAKLAAKVASQEMQLEVWRRSASIKADCESRIAAGESVDDVERDLCARMTQALVEQYGPVRKRIPDDLEHLVQGRPPARKADKPKPERPPGGSWLHAAVARTVAPNSQTREE